MWKSCHKPLSNKVVAAENLISPWRPPGCPIIVRMIEPHEQPQKKMTPPPSSKALSPIMRRWTSLRSMQENQRLYILGEFAKVRGLMPLLMPGGILVLPLLAWWLDRRRQNRKDKDIQ